MHLTYAYAPSDEIADGAVYSFKNFANGEYITVNSNTDYASAVLAPKSSSAWTQSFRLEWNSSAGAYNVHTLVSSGSSTSYVLTGDGDVVYGDGAVDLNIYRQQAS